MPSPPPLPSIAIVGPGRLGRSLEALLAERSFPVPLVGRGEVVPLVDVVVLAVPDRALAAAAAALPRGPIVLHCSGAATVDILAPHRPRGSWHPLMTFPGSEVALPDLDGVPAAVAGDPEAVAVAVALTRALGMAPLHVTGDRRLYHASAVLAGNLATVLLAEAARALEAAGVEATEARRALFPLAQQSLRNAIEDPARALTGPVVRGDLSTLDGHRDALRTAGLVDLIELVDLLQTRGSRLIAPTPEGGAGPSPTAPRSGVGRGGEA